jgi:hypothetical protein
LAERHKVLLPADYMLDCCELTTRRQLVPKQITGS